MPSLNLISTEWLYNIAVWRAAEKVPGPDPGDELFTSKQWSCWHGNANSDGVGDDGVTLPGDVLLEADKIDRLERNTKTVATRPKVAGKLFILVYLKRRNQITIGSYIPILSLHWLDVLTSHWPKENPHAILLYMA